METKATTVQESSITKKKGTQQGEVSPSPKCPLCHSRRVQVIQKEASWGLDLMECYACEVVFLDLKGTPTSEFYADTYYPPSPLLFEKIDAWARSRQIRRSLPAGARVLEVGCGHGLTLHRLQNKGYSVMGTEFSEHAAGYARDQLGISMHVGPVETIPAEEGTFDFICLYHVFEHLDDPQAALKQFRRLLKPGGRLLVEVPHYRSAFARWFGARWFHLDVPRHVFHYGVKSLTAALNREGFEVDGIKTRYFLYDVFGNVQSFLNGFLKTKQILNGKEVQASFKLSDIMRRPRVYWELVAARLMWPVLFAGFAMVQAVFWALNIEGGTLTVEAKLGSDQVG